MRTLFLIGLSWMALGAAAELPRSLVSRMLDAREGFKASAKEMRVAEDADAASEAWPFDVARIETLLEKGLVRDAKGVYRLRRDAADDSHAAGTAALAYVNDVISDWALMQLDAKFPRTDAATLRALAGYRVDLDADFWMRFSPLPGKGELRAMADKAGGWMAGWKIREKLYLLVTADIRDPCRPRDYQFVMWDGAKDWPIAGFDEFPDAVRANTVIRLTTSPAAANNLAAQLHARDANRRLYLPEYVETLLRRSASGGCEAAFHNLGVLMEERGDREQAAAFFSRGKPGQRE